jgi:hypothetical protein
MGPEETSRHRAVDTGVAIGQLYSNSVFTCSRESYCDGLRLVELLLPEAQRDDGCESPFALLGHDFQRAAEVVAHKCVPNRPSGERCLIITERHVFGRLSESVRQLRARIMMGRHNIYTLFDTH